MSTCRSIDDIVESASFILADQEDGHEYTSFPQDVLRSFACQILPLLAQVHPEKFTKPKTVRLGVGSEHDLGDHCGSVVSVSSFSLNGATVPAGKVEDAALLRRFAQWPTRCVSCHGKAPSQIKFAIDPDNPSTLVIDPPVGHDDDMAVNIQCRDEASLTRDPSAPMPDKAADLIPAIREWVLFSATSTDDEMVEGCSANVHYRAFINLVPAAAEALKLRAKSVAGKQR
jgi:hypothetical protein